MPANNWHMLVVLLLWVVLSLVTGHPGMGMLYTLLAVLATVLSMPLWAPPLALLVNGIAHLRAKRQQH